MLYSILTAVVAHTSNICSPSYERQLGLLVWIGAIRAARAGPATPSRLLCHVTCVVNISNVIAECGT